MKRLLGLLLICLMCFFGCSPKPKTQQPVELTFWTLQLQPFAPYINGLIADYEKAHPTVKITWVDMPQSEGEKRALTAMLADKVPDVVNLNPDFSAILASRGTLLKLNEWVSPEQKQSYLPVTWLATSLDDKPFGVPWYLTSSITLYNSQLLKQAGIDAPPKTYAELYPAAQAVKAKTHGYLLMPSLADGGRFFRVLAKAGIPIWDEKGRLVFADHGADHILATWVKLYREGLIPAESITEGQQAAVDQYQSGKLGLLFTGPNFLNIVAENAPQIYKNTRVQGQFPKNDALIDFSEMILVIPKKSAHPKEAVDFALFITNAENTQKLCDLAPVLSPHRSVLDGPLFNDTPDNVKRHARWLSAQQLLNAKTAYRIHPQQSRLNQLMDLAVQRAFLGQLSPSQALQKTQNEMNTLLHP